MRNIKQQIDYLGMSLKRRKIDSRIVDGKGGTPSLTNHVSYSKAALPRLPHLEICSKRTVYM